MNKFGNQMDVEHVLNKFMGSLAGYQSDALPVYSFNSVTENLTYIQRNEKGLPMMGQDPHWDRPHDFQGYVRAPLDRRVQDFGFIWDEHIYNVNPLAGTGSDNVNFLAGGAEQQLSEMALLPTIQAAQGNAFATQVTNVLDPTTVNAFLHNQEMLQQAMNEYKNTPEYKAAKPEDKKIDAGKKMLYNGEKQSSGVTVVDRNILQSQGMLMVNDKEGRHATHTRDGQPISYMVDGSIYQAEKRDADPLGTEPVDKEDGPQQWQAWFGYPDVNNSTRHTHFESSATKGNLDQVHENLVSNNLAQKYLTDADRIAAEQYTMQNAKTKQMFLDYERPFDPLPVHLWDANDNFGIQLEQSQKHFDLDRLG